MAEIEEVSSDLLSIVLPTVLGVAMVLVTVAVVFWMGSGPQRSYEEAKAQASLKAEETLKGKEQASPKAKKPRKNFRKKKADEHQEEPEPVAPRKGILKGQSAGVEASAERTPAERTPPNKVEFKLDTTPKETKAPRVDPPTPYPTKDTAQTELAKAPPPPPPPQPIFEEPEPEPVEQPLSRKSVPKKKPPVQAAIGKHEPAERVAIPKEPEIKKRTKNKPKPSGTGDSQDVISASRITDIVGGSSLTDEEIQRLIELLLEKSNANAEWEGANLKAESNKSLKKQNQELQSRMEEAQQAAVSYSNKIKELRKEMQSEKARHQSAENTLQLKLTQKANECAIFKTRALGMEEEIKQMMPLADTQLIREDNNQLKTRLQQQMLNNQVLESRAAGSRTEILRLTAELQSHADARDELKQKVDRSEAANSQLVVDLNLAKGDGLAHMKALQEDLERSRSADARVKAELQREGEELRKGAAEVVTLRETIAQQDGKLAEQGQQLASQVEVNHSLEEKVASLTQQFEAEQTRNKEAMKELEAQSKSTPNGLVTMAPLSNGDQPPAVDEGEPEEVAILEKKLEDLKSRNNELSESLWKAKNEAGVAENEWEEKIKQVQEQVELRASSAKTEALVESYGNHKALLQQLFPEVSVQGCNDKHQQWLERFEAKAQDLMSSRKEENSSLKQKVQDLEARKEESTSEVLHFRHTLENTMNILGELQTKVETSSSEHQLELKNKETALEMERSSNRRLQGELGDERDLVSQVRAELGKEHNLVGKLQEDVENERDVAGKLQEELEKEHDLVGKIGEELEREKEIVSRVQEELETSRGGGEETAARLEQRLQEVEESRKNMEQQVADLNEELKTKEAAQQKLEQNIAAESKLKEDAVTKLETANKNLKDHLETMKQSNRELNARISSLIVPSPTDSEV